ncbi:MAG: type II toxin-antitoxin system ParD family antitoxin [Pseudomonadota bacterium]
MEKLSVEVPADLAASVRARVQSGQYASESEAVTAALSAAEDDAQGIETWLRGPVAEAYDAVERCESVLMTSDEVRARLGLRAG